MQVNFVVARTPLRISFAGGGTDLPAFYRQDYGAVFSTTIDKYLYVTVKRHSEIFSEAVRLNYSETELVDRVEDIKNDIARECLLFLKIEPPIYISTVGDIPGSTGLGSSSSFAVGLLNALHILKGERVSDGQLAEEASHIEIDVLKHPIGKQDQYTAAFGGMNFFRFMPDGGVAVQAQRLSNGAVKNVFDNILLFWTGMVRDTNSVLSEQLANLDRNMDVLKSMRDHALQLNELMKNGFNIEGFGRILDESWRLKRNLASTVTNGKIDDWYQRGINSGAKGGKLCGAGGGGFLLFVCAPERREAVKKALPELMEIPVAYESRGSRVLMPSL